MPSISHEPTGSTIPPLRDSRHAVRSDREPLLETRHRHPDGSQAPRSKPKLRDDEHSACEVLLRLTRLALQTACGMLPLAGYAATFEP